MTYVGGIFLVLAYFAASASANSAVVLDMPLPQPIPEDQWIGKTSLNYTALHDEYAELVTCLYIPVGVLGFYQSIFPLIGCIEEMYTLYSNLKKYNLQGEKRRWWHTVVPGILHFALSIYQIIEASRSTLACRNQGVPGFDLVSKGVIARIIGAAFAGLGCFVACFTWIASDESSRRSINVFAGYLVLIGYGLQLISGGIYFQQLLEEKSPGKATSQMIDQVKLEASITVIWPGILVVVGWVLIFALSRCSGSYRLWNWSGPEWVRRYFWKKCTPPVAGGIFFVSSGLMLFVFGIGFVTLGKILGDAWGLNVLSPFLEVFSTLMTCGIPVVNGIIILFAEGLGIAVEYEAVPVK